VNFQFKAVTIGDLTVSQLHVKPRQLHAAKGGGSLSIARHVSKIGAGDA
jgi:hypothetical protein